MMDLRGQTAIVTGGTRGIGLAIAKALTAEGVGVAICGRNHSVLKAALRELNITGRAVGHTCDVANPQQAEDFYSFVDRELGGVDTLVNNAGIGHFAPVDQLTPEEWDEVIGTNLSGPFYFSRLAVPRMKRRGGGFILNIGSLAGKHPFATGAAYNASKFGLAGFTEAMMLDLRYANIRVSTIMPGSVQTAFRSGTKNADWKLDPAAIASMAVHLIKTPERKPFESGRDASQPSSSIVATLAGRPNGSRVLPFLRATLPSPSHWRQFPCAPSPIPPNSSSFARTSSNRKSLADTRSW